MVDGRYRVVGKNMKSIADLLVITDKLVDKVRQERKSKTKKK